MDEFDLAKFNIGMAGFNVAMIGYGALEGQTDVMALNGALLPLNLGLAAFNGRGQIDQVRSELRTSPEKAVGAVYDTALSGRVEQKVDEAADEVSVEGGPGSHCVETGRCRSYS